MWIISSTLRNNYKSLWQLEDFLWLRPSRNFRVWIMDFKLLSLLLSCFWVPVMAEEPLTQLIIWAKDGTRVAYALEDAPEVNFTETDLTITTNSIEVNYNLEDMAKITYEANNGTFITNLSSGESPFKFNGDALIFHFLDIKTAVTIHSLNGELILRKFVQSAGEYAFPLSGLTPGVYIVKLYGLTFKIAKR